MSNICDNIKKARTAAGKSQLELAEILKMKRSTYAKYELTTIPDVLTLVDIGKALKIDWTSLVNETITGEAFTPGKTDIEMIEAHLKEAMKLTARLKGKDKKK